MVLGMVTQYRGGVQNGWARKFYYIKLTKGGAKVSFGALGGKRLSGWKYPITVVLDEKPVPNNNTLDHEDRTGRTVPFGMEDDCEPPPPQTQYEDVKNGARGR